MEFQSKFMASVVWAFLFFSVFIAGPSRASEADFFTRREGLPDGIKFLDQKMNETLATIAAESNSCLEVDLHAAVLGALGGFVTATIEKWGDEIPGSYAIPFNQSIYAGLDGEARYLDWGCCSPIFRMGNTLVSADKLGHFLDSGYQMYFVYRSVSQFPVKDKRGVLSKAFDWFESPIDGPKVDKIKAKYGVLERPAKGKRLEEIEDKIVLDISHMQEEGSWGLAGTGVKSFGDIAANYEGFLFWKDLSRGNNPYFECKGKKWTLKRVFKWDLYVSDAWDEAISCNQYATPLMRTAIAARTRNLAQRLRWPSKVCPVEPLKCGPLNDRYKIATESALSPACRRAAYKRNVSGEVDDRAPTAARLVPKAITIRDAKKESRSALQAVIECYNSSLKREGFRDFATCARPHFDPAWTDARLRHQMLFLLSVNSVSDLRGCADPEARFLKSFDAKNLAAYRCFDFTDRDGREHRGFALIGEKNRVASLRVF